MLQGAGMLGAGGKAAGWGHGQQASGAAEPTSSRVRGLGGDENHGWEIQVPQPGKGQS